MKIKLICDSMCDIPEEINNKEFVEMIPLTINIDGKEYKDGVDFTKEEFYDVLKNSENLPKTSQITYVDFKDTFEKYTKEGYDIICITGSSKASGTFQSANLAKADVDGNIYIFDSLFLSLGSGQYVIKAAQLIEEGKLNAKQIVDELENIRGSVNLLFVPFTLEYLKQSGRLPSVVSFVGNMLSIKPICTMEDGKNKIVSKVRGTKQIASKLVDMILELNGGNLEDKILTIGYGSNEADFKKLQQEVSKKIKAKKIYITRGGSCICSHTGPEILAISSSY
ncbi:DegV family protein [Intestinibacter sp.]|uniref:DegV family protein n=1 Tax=Intestinibacter sp. TaxID=1965304 RepID=UPI002A761422|nr:DegV family protein [Intestinibacter sp.]MDY2737559.1 DegV family protein [Intestinibacter sp.]MDY4574780.1 DegV family protein [Intestinibacter sp.]